MRTRRRDTTSAALSALACTAVIALGTVPAAAEGGGLAPQKPAAQPAALPAGAITPADLADLDHALDAAEQAALTAADELFQASAQSADARIAIDETVVRADEARDALTDRVREVYMSGTPDPMSQALLGFGKTSDLGRVASAGAQSDRTLIDGVEKEAKALDALRRRVAREEAAITEKARKVAALQERTSALLAAAQIRYADDQVKLAALAERRRQLDAQAAATKAASLAATQAADPAKPAQLPGVMPTVTVRGQQAAAAQAPVIAGLEAAGAGFPPGYRATGRTISGQASWYGPGFYGKPTATGAPYDAERFTCAMLAVPLGTVVRVSTAEGRSVNVLVNDRGPYVGSRVIDMSAAGARMLGYSGVKQVTIEVLEPVR